jgi:hypothetical protein
MSSSKGTGPGGDFSKISSEIAEMRGELKAIGDSVRALQRKVGTPLLFDGNVTTPDPNNPPAYYTPGQDLRIVIQFAIPGDASLFVSGYVSYQDDDGSPVVNWLQDGAATIDAIANKVAFSVRTPVINKSGPVKPSKAAKKPSPAAKKLYSGTGTGTVIHTKNLILFQSQFTSSGLLSLVPA